MVITVLQKLNLDIDWYCKSTWKRSSFNTLWCLLGCSIGDFGTIAFFQFSDFSMPTLYVMTLAIINGIITSIILESIVLSRQMNIKDAIKTALGMSLISMISMEVAMNTNYVISWILNTPPIQLLEIKSSWKSLSLIVFD